MENLRKIESEEKLNNEKSININKLKKENLEDLRFNIKVLQKSSDEFAQKILDNNKDLIEYEKQKKLLNKNEEKEEKKNKKKNK